MKWEVDNYGQLSYDLLSGSTLLARILPQTEPDSDYEFGFGYIIILCIDGNYGSPVSDHDEIVYNMFDYVLLSSELFPFVYNVELKEIMKMIEHFVLMNGESL